ncbi:MAG: exo-alpha-sialidase [Planctomycetes bacterium]|nr:exo-alpha-sialidase [Planctomycetota bacterium]
MRYRRRWGRWTTRVCRLAMCLPGSLAAAPPAPQPTPDPRNIRHGTVIPDEGYCDQPYVVITRDGNWLCTLTTGRGVEGQPGQHVVATISADKGRTWSPLIDIEPADGPEASWVMPLVTPSSRVYVFYDYNGDRDTPVHMQTLGGARADMLGWYVYKFSDDNGRTWSPQRYRLPVRTTEIDRYNSFGGRIEMLWGIGKPIIAADTVILGFSKIGGYVINWSEGWFLVSDNILTEPDPARITWHMRPEGDIGVQPVLGPISEEQNLVPLGDGSLYTMYRTVEGHPCHAYSRDCARSWTLPAYAEYSPGGRRIKHPRACPRLWKTANGNYLFWFHNNGQKSYEGRNPAWITGGIEKQGRIHWSQPEILLYDPDPAARISYPDLIEQDGRYWITETQKTVARVHEIAPTLLTSLWNQGKVKQVTRRGLLVDAGSDRMAAGSIPLPRLPELREGQGLTIEAWLRFEDPPVDRVLLDARSAVGKGFVLKTAANRAVRIEFSDGRTGAFWDSDPLPTTRGRLHHVACIVDAGPRIIMFMVDGVLCDGGDTRPYGWGLFNPALVDVNPGAPMRIDGAAGVGLHRVRIYNRALRTSEVIGNNLAGEG